MNIVRNSQEYKIELIDNNGIKLLELKFIADEFVCIFYVQNPIVIKETDDPFLYNNLINIMKNNYIFSNDFNVKQKDLLIFLSDQAYDQENKKEIDKINRLIIKRINNKLSLSIYNPYLEENNIKKSFGLICFSTSGNGQFSKNIDTNTTLQTDLVIAFQNILNKNNPNHKTKLVKEKIIRK